eukprot:CAMPEP_0167768510 /NCGR_PEP_ID=MMETSP0110_2-20121227/16714_1 /TAXON_ID=629695 /ORGANISM="Gymnochlora sp., Strain CCMP2014" /LENGTH=220 /DNA_ID=CAMNT_0007657205 /DNA_START=226 /DNA_END=888 /DNA_ORIENTATION=+
MWFFSINGADVCQTGLFAERKGTSAKKDLGAPAVPYSFVFGVVGQLERDLWVEEIKNAHSNATAPGFSEVKAKSVDSKTGESKQSSSCRPKRRKEGWLYLKPIVITKDTPWVWTKKYVILDGQQLHILDVKFKEALLLNQWDVHSFNKIEPTITPSMIPSWMPTKTGFSYHFSVSNRNSLFKLGADSPEQRSFWIRSLQKLKLSAHWTNGGKQKQEDVKA